MANPGGGRSGSLDLASLSIDPASGEPRYRQIVAQLRAAIDCGALGPTTRWGLRAIASNSAFPSCLSTD